jgi:hypothetical protein
MKEKSNAYRILNREFWIEKAWNTQEQTSE